MAREGRGREPGPALDGVGELVHDFTHAGDVQVFATRRALEFHVEEHHADQRDDGGEEGHADHGEPLHVVRELVLREHDAPRIVGDVGRVGIDVHVHLGPLCFVSGDAGERDGVSRLDLSENRDERRGGNPANSMLAFKK